MFVILFALLFCSQIVECAPGKMGKKGRNALKATATTTVPTPTVVGTISLNGLTITPPASSNHVREELTFNCAFNCAMCDNQLSTNLNDLLMCGGCEITYYCSKKCQKSHWKSHKVSITILLILKGELQRIDSTPRVCYKNVWEQPPSQI
jgi:hypothetical protein